MAARVESVQVKRWVVVFQVDMDWATHGHLPKCPVMKNSVTDEPMDIKALMTQVYDGAKVLSV